MCSDRVRLDFLRSTPQDFVPDPVDASDIAEVLLENQVNHVVMNACRSGHASNLDMNIAATLISCVLSAVVAMSYQVPYNSVQKFTRAFYRGLFSRTKVTFAEAV